MLDPGEKGRLGNGLTYCLTDTTRGDLDERGVHMELLLLDGCGCRGLAVVAADVDGACAGWFEGAGTGE
jgi:hypothetical protein